MLTMVTGYARWASAVLVPSRRVEDLFAGWWQLISRLEFEHDNPAPQAVEAGTALDDAGAGEGPLEGTAEAGGEHGEGEDAGLAAGNPAPSASPPATAYRSRRHTIAR